MSVWVDHLQDGPRLKHDATLRDTMPRPCHAIDFHGPAAATSRHGGSGRPFDSCDRKKDALLYNPYNVTLPLPRLPGLPDCLPWAAQL